MASDRKECDEAAQALIAVYHRHGVRALVITFDGDRVVVACARESDVEPLCRHVIEQRDAPDVRTLN